MDELLMKVKANLILEHSADEDYTFGYSEEELENALS